MRKTLISLLLCAATAISCIAHPVNTNKLNVVYTNTPSEWNDFNWAWSAASDQALEIDFYGQQPSNLFLRLSKPDGSQYLTTQAGSLSDFGTNYRRWSVYIAKSNLPPSNVYRTEILSSSDSTTNIQDAVTLVMSKGRTRVQWSSFDGSPSTNNIWIYGDGWFTEHDLKALAQIVVLSNWVEAVRSGLVGSNTYLLSYIDSLFLSATNRMHSIETSRYTKIESDARFLTNGSIVAESDPIWLAQKSLYATTNLLHTLAMKHADATNKLEIAYGWGNHGTNGYIRSALTNEYLQNGAQLMQLLNTNRPGAGIPYVRVSKPSIYYPLIELYEAANNTTSRFGVYNGRLSEVEADGGGGIPYWNDNTNGIGEISSTVSSMATNLANATNNIRINIQQDQSTSNAINSRLTSIESAGYITPSISGSFIITNGYIMLTSYDVALGKEITLKLERSGTARPYNIVGNTNGVSIENDVLFDRPDGIGQRGSITIGTSSSPWDSYFSGGVLATGAAYFAGNAPYITNFNLSAGTNAPANWANQSMDEISNSMIQATTLLSNTLQRTVSNGSGQVISNSLGLVLYGTNTPNAYSYAGILTSLAGVPLNGFVSGRSDAEFTIFGAATNEAGALARYSGGNWLTIYDKGNFSPESYLLYAEYVAFKTNIIYITSGVVTQGQIGASTRRDMYVSGTNIQLNVGGTNWLKIEGRLNVY